MVSDLSMTINPYSNLSSRLLIKNIYISGGLGGGGSWVYLLLSTRLLHHQDDHLGSLSHCMPAYVKILLCNF